ncbi:MAG: hypothetical protein JNM63_16200, partial [Spirochaetia bacterium]|nr:hypothetical protein [Spirochaetia bacterium]
RILKKIKYEVSLSGDLDAPKDGVLHAGLRNSLGLNLSNLLLRSSFFMKKDFDQKPPDLQIPWLWDNEGRLTFSLWECGLKVSVFDAGKDSGFSRFESANVMDIAPVYLQGRGLRLMSRLGFHFANAWQLGFGGAFEVRENAAMRFSLSMLFQTEWGG